MLNEKLHCYCACNTVVVNRGRNLPRSSRTEGNKHLERVLQACASSEGVGFVYTCAPTLYKNSLKYTP